MDITKVAGTNDPGSRLLGTTLEVLNKVLYREIPPKGSYPYPLTLKALI